MKYTEADLKEIRNRACAIRDFSEPTPDNLHFWWATFNVGTYDEEEINRVWAIYVNIAQGGNARLLLT